MRTGKTNDEHGRARKALGGAARRTGLANMLRRSGIAQRTFLGNRRTVQADRVQAGIEWAQLAMAEGDWPQAIARWHELLLRYGPSASSRIYTGLANAYIRSDAPSTAAAVIERGRSLFPNAVDLPLLWAHLASVDEDWEESIRRYLQILDNVGPDASWRIHKGLVVAYIELNDLRKASEAAELGLRSFADNVDVASAWARIPLKAEDWDEAILRWQKVVDQFGPTPPWRAFASLSLAYGKSGDLETALKAVERGSEHYPGEVRLAAHAAEIAMARKDWTLAVDRWSEVLELRIADRPASQRGELLPTRGSVWDWYEEAWHEIASRWDLISQGLANKPSPLVLRSFARTMKQAGLPDDALALLRWAARAHPADDWLGFDLAMTQVESHSIHGQPKAPTTTQGTDACQRAQRFVDTIHNGTSERAAAATPTIGNAPDSAEAVVARNAEVLAEFHPSGEPASEGLGSVHVIRVPAGCSVELELKAGRYFSAAALERRVAEVSRRDRWDEMISQTDVLLERARAAADMLGTRFEEPPFLTAEAYSDAALFLLYQELSVYEPMRRLAADIAAEGDAVPVFIESPVDTYRYFDGDPFTHFDVLFFYFELRRLGVNAFLCCLLKGELQRGVTPLRVLPGLRSLIPQTDPTRQPNAPAEQALFPAGIRSVRRVADAIGPSVVYSAGSVVKEFAYDRSFKQDFPVNPSASVHPPFSTLPELVFAMTPSAVLGSVPLIPEIGLGAEARIETSEPIGRDWLFWVDHVIHDYFKEIAMRSFAEASARRITEAHTADHMYPDAVLFGDAVKRNGGRLVLWPHSANPVHVNDRRQGSFDEVHAVTRTGCERWASRFPDVDVKHTPSAMLDPVTRDATRDRDLPLSIVVFGGRTVLRYMPQLDQARHEASYQDFFRGIARLQETHSIDLYFKPRGYTGEHEMWLSRTVGTTANWNRALQHPLRIDLPNPLFVSISTGSSALIEGLGRGIPGIIVRDFPVRDYTTLDQDTLPIGPTSEMLAIIESLFEADGYERLVERELAHYATEVQVVDQSR